MRRKTSRPVHRQFKKNLEIKIFFVITVVLVIYLSFLLYSDAIAQFLQTTPYVSEVYASVTSEISEKSVLGLMYLAFASGLFFLTIPVEAAFFVFVAAGHDPLIVIFVMSYAFTCSLIFDYWFGALIGRKLFDYISEEKKRKYTRYSQKLGPVIVFLFNLFPLPSPFLSLFVGATRFSFPKFLFFSFFGNVAKYTVAMVIYTNVVELFPSLIA